MSRHRLLAFAAALASVGPLVAQAPDAIGLPLEELPARVFDARDGVPRAFLYKVRPFIGDALWLASEHGAYTFDGRRWRRYAAPDSLQPPQIRDIQSLGAPNDLFFAMRTGALRDSAGRQTFFPFTGPDLQGPVWGLIVTRALDGRTRQLVAVLQRGLARWTGRGFEAIPLPPGMPSTALMAAPTERNGTPTLWIGSLDGGVARYRNGRWERMGPEHGIPADISVEHFAATPPGDADEVLVSTARGLWAFDGTRFRALRSSGYHLRAARIRNRDRFETWTATGEGDLLRDDAQGRWSVVRPTGRVPSGAAQGMSVVRDEDGSVVLYVGYRGGELARFRVGRAETVLMPERARGRTVRALEPEGVGVVFGLIGGSVWSLAGAPGDPPQYAPGPVDVVRFHRASEAVGGGLWATTVEGTLWRRTAGRWVRDEVRGPELPLGTLTEGAGPDGVRTLLGGDGRGTVWYRTPSGWRAWPQQRLLGSVSSIVADTAADGRPALWVGTSVGLHQWRGAQWQLAERGSAQQLAPISRVVLEHRGTGRRRLWVATTGSGIHWLDPDAPTPTLQRLVLPPSLGTRGEIVRDLHVDEDGTLVAATSGGLFRLRAPADRGPAQVVASLGAEDGLPNDDVLEIAPVAGLPGRWWIGTLGGLAQAIVPHETPPVAAGAFRAVLERNDTTLGTNVVLPFSERAVEVSAALRTDYREEAVRYRLEVRGADSLSTPWTEGGRFPLPTLGAGTYDLRVWAADANGREIGPAVLQLEIRAPLWRSWPALVLYAGLAALVGGLVASIRTRALQREQELLRENERRLTESEQRFRALFDESTDAQLLADGGFVVAANPAAGRLLADAPDGSPLRNTRLLDLLPALAQAPRVGDVETEARTLGGTARPVALHRSTFTLGGTELVHVQLKDLRGLRALAQERAALEHQLRESQRIESLGTLAGGVAHDFNNLLTVIRHGAQMIREAELAGETDPESIEAILSASARARELVQQILAFSRRLPTRTERLRLHDVLADVQPMLRASLPAAVRLVIEERAPAAVVEGDRTQLVQVLVNLATNAEHAMRGRAEQVLAIRTDLVTVPFPEQRGHRALPPGRYVRLTVSDTGSGMSEEVQARVFEPFFTTKPTGEGTGLGLAVLHGIVTAHRGSVVVQSAPEQGTTVEVLLPELEGGAVDPVPEQPSLPGALLGQVLLVDDETLVLAATQRLLARHGLTVTACARAAEAQALLETDHPYDVLVTDLSMPDMGGDALARAAARLRPGLPVIMVTGFAGDPQALARRLGVFEILEKPYELRDLLAAIGRALGRR